MSTGARFSWSDADSIASAACRCWGLDPGASIVGSLRRHRDEVGDIELIAPMEKEHGDRLFAAINGTMANPYSDQAAALFNPVVVPSEPMGRSLRGLKPGFAAASLVLTPWTGVEIACQVYRYTPRNAGWVQLMRTGPREFGMWFLGRWKRAKGIPIGVDDRPACVENHLVDAGGNIVAVPTEADAFFQVGSAVIEPSMRDAFMESRSKKGAARE